MANSAARRGLEKARSDEEVYAMLRTALSHALRRAGATVRSGALRMRTDKSTVVRAAKTGRVNIAHVLRSRRIAKHFLGCLLLLNGSRA